VVVRDNRMGRNGWGPAFSGGPMIAQMLGGAIPPVMWDGVVEHAQNKDPVRVRLADGPVLNLRLPAPGQVEKARPEIVKTFGDAQIAEPAAVVLPKAQADLGA
jgi:hypothetical protein